MSLTVRIGDTPITRLVEDLSFSRGLHGPASCGFNYRAPVTSTLFVPFEKVYVFDGATADVMWEGRLEDSGRAVDGEGQAWSVQAVGETARAEDRALPYIIIDTDLSRYERRGKVVPSSTAEVRDNAGADNADAIHLQFNPGQPIDATSFITMIYPAMQDAGQLLGGFGYSWDAGITAAASHELQVDVEGDTLATTRVRTHGFSTAGGSDSAQLTGGAFTGAQTLVLRHQRTAAATTIGSEDRWGSFYNLYVVALRLNKDATQNLTSADYLRDHVFAHEVVADLLGRVLTGYDGANADLDTTSTYQIDQFAYPDGATATQILEDLMALQPNYYWQVGPDLYGNGPTFQWVKWPTTVRYEMSMADGLDLPGAEAERYNRVTVRWVDKRDRVKTQTYNAGTTINGIVVPAVAELDDQGLIRQPEIQDLADEVGSQAAADKFAAEYLLEHGTPPVSGTLTVARKVWDHDTGRFVQPYEILPGHLCRVRELADNAADLGVTDRDGKSVFRVVGVDYNADTHSATVELDAPTRTNDELLAKQIKRRRRKR